IKRRDWYQSRNTWKFQGTRELICWHVLVDVFLKITIATKKTVEFYMGVCGVALKSLSEHKEEGLVSVPKHMEIPGNKRTDMLARLGRRLPQNHNSNKKTVEFCMGVNIQQQEYAYKTVAPSYTTVFQFFNSSLDDRGLFSSVFTVRQLLGRLALQDQDESLFRHKEKGLVSVPKHMEIPGNKRTDLLARLGRRLPQNHNSNKKTVEFCMGRSVLICFYSQAAVRAVSSPRPRRILVQLCGVALKSLSRHKEEGLVSVPKHMEIPGNKRTDLLARLGRRLPQNHNSN
ncbi:hypothetical protein NQ315_000740, partial [Exocentrus adspersus]